MKSRNQQLREAKQRRIVIEQARKKKETEQAPTQELLGITIYLN
jgi:hypothetical protein